MRGTGFGGARGAIVLLLRGADGCFQRRLSRDVRLEDGQVLAAVAVARVFHPRRIPVLQLPLITAQAVLCVCVCAEAGWRTYWLVRI